MPGVGPAGYPGSTPWLLQGTNRRERPFLDRWFPSSKLCSTTGCSHKNTKMPLNVRSWACPSCGTRHDRDVNAAKNILAAGLAERQNACGGTVSPSV